MYRASTRDITKTSFDTAWQAAHAHDTYPSKSHNRLIHHPSLSTKRCTIDQVAGAIQSDNQLQRNSCILNIGLFEGLKCSNCGVFFFISRQDERARRYWLIFNHNPAAWNLEEPELYTIMTKPWIKRITVVLMLSSIFLVSYFSYINDDDSDTHFFRTIPLLQGSHDGGSLVISGRFIVSDMPCNIAQIDLQNEKWLLKGVS